MWRRHSRAEALHVPRRQQEDSRRRLQASAIGRRVSRDEEEDTEGAKDAGQYAKGDSARRRDEQKYKDDSECDHESAP